MGDAAAAVRAALLGFAGSDPKEAMVSAVWGCVAVGGGEGRGSEQGAGNGWARGVGVCLRVPFTPPNTYTTFLTVAASSTCGVCCRRAAA